MQHQKTWTITEFRDGEAHEVITGATQAEAIREIRRAMYGGDEAVAALAETSVHELSLAA